MSLSYEIGGAKEGMIGSVGRRYGTTANADARDRFL
jgi:hypothetical protein